MLKLFNIFLTPLVLVYAAIIGFRNFLFNYKIFKSGEVNSLVISVGNITVGGAGKTPMVLYLVEILREMSRKPGVLSRGYGRNSKGYLLVSNGEEVFCNVDFCGDEIYQTVTDSKVPGAVSEDRFKGAQKFLKEADIDTIILDDGFQHRWIKRDIDLVVCEQRFLLNDAIDNMSLIPIGNMREPFSSLDRADAVIINRKFSEDSELPAHIVKYFKGKQIFKAHYLALSFVDIKRNSEHPMEEFHGQKSLVVSGIANPFSLINILKQSKVDTDNQLIFRDHKNYSSREVQKIRKAYYTFNAHSVITTHKDAVKLVSFTKDFDDIDIFYLKIKMEIDNREEFVSFLKNKIEQTS